MNIENAKYYKHFPTDENDTGIYCTINGENSYVPINPANRHYAEIMRQVEAGTLTIAPADEE